MDDLDDVSTPNDTIPIYSLSHRLLMTGDATPSSDIEDGRNRNPPASDFTSKA